jgi:hypothetical protein
VIAPGGATHCTFPSPLFVIPAEEPGPSHGCAKGPLLCPEAERCRFSAAFWIPAFARKTGRLRSTPSLPRGREAGVVVLPSGSRIQCGMTGKEPGPQPRLRKGPPTLPRGREVSFVIPGVTRDPVTATESALVVTRQCEAHCVFPAPLFVFPAEGAGSQSRLRKGPPTLPRGREVSFVIPGVTRDPVTATESALVVTRQCEAHSRRVPGRRAGT